LKSDWIIDEFDGKITALSVVSLGGCGMEMAGRID
jgi:hypothetical protein